MKLKNLFFVMIGMLIIQSCDPKIYSPELDALRDPDLFGTWRSIYNTEKDSSFFVFTDEGYVGSTTYINNAQMNGFSNLHEIWKNIEEIDADGWGKIYIADGSSFWTMQRNENEHYYKLSESKDSLFLSYVNLRTKEANKEKPDTFLRNYYQLIYDGSTYIGIE